MLSTAGNSIHHLLRNVSLWLVCIPQNCSSCVYETFSTLTHIQYMFIKVNLSGINTPLPCIKCAVSLVLRSAPPSSKFFSVKCTPNVQYTISPPPQETSHLSPIPLKGNSVLLITMRSASQDENDSKVK